MAKDPTARHRPLSIGSAHLERPILLTTARTSEKKLYIPSNAVNTHAISPVAHPYPRLPGRTLRPPWPCPRSVSRRPGICGNECGPSGASAKPKRSRTSRVRLSPTALGLTTIQNLRTASSPGLTRLVLDLDAKARPSKHPQLQAEGVTIEIPNAILSPSAKTKLAAGRIAKPFHHHPVI